MKRKTSSGAQVDLRKEEEAAQDRRFFMVSDQQVLL